MSTIERILAEGGRTIDAPDDLEAVQALFTARGWSDGLPVVPPTPARVAAMLAYCDRPLDRPIAVVAPRYAPALPWRLAANAVMAGCRPEHFPLVVAAIEALAQPAVNLYGVQATTHPCSTLLLFNGPIPRALGVSGGCNALGPGHPANATIGRAVRLALLNIGGALPGSVDMATLGSLAKFTFCAAENEAQSPWEPLHVERGFAAEHSTVTVLGTEGPHNINDHESIGARSLLMTIAGTIATTGSNNAMHASTPIVAFCPEHAATVAAGGFTKASIREFLYQHAVEPMGRFAPENVERRLKKKFPERYAAGDADTPVTMVQAAEDFVIVVLGGAGKHSAYFPTFGTTRALTHAIATADGTPARSIDDFRRSGAT